MMQDHQCMGVRAEVLSDNAIVLSGSVCPLEAASWLNWAWLQMRPFCSENFHMTELCEVIKGCSICSLVPLLSFLIDLFQALEVESCRQQASLPEMSLFIALISSVSGYATGMHKTRLYNFCLYFDRAGPLADRGDSEGLYIHGKNIDPCCGSGGIMRSHPSIRAVYILECPWARWT